MDADQSLAIIKALADESRLAIVGSLLEQPQYVEEIAKRHALAPSTVSFHLKKLEHAGLIRSRKEQYYVMVTANEGLLHTTLKELVEAGAAGRAVQEQRFDDYRAKVVATFFPHGTLERLPAQHKKRLIVLEQFAARFEEGHRYMESEVTGLIRPLFDDYCTVRRLLVDEGLIRRDDSHYWREAPATETRVLPLPKAPKSRASHSETPRQRRAELKREYQESRPAMGIYQIRNTNNGRLFIDGSIDLKSAKTSREFQLRMGSFPSSQSLKKDLAEHGAPAFEFTVLEELPPPQPGERTERLLLAAKLRWQRQLQPFGDQGYNSRAQFERETNQV
ncbi:metalloregulator ArsR/SmtB family transcription factor [Geomesophilobacter sediminis]|uniref:Metalloregulator ArsR/SmtB family transcription factor n=1 Tax=Geomesophilobacter sediminis TaxID=2798584 RepID=A0A8J7IN26_9BACT|nr:metalloregulator ArsR/SmtB family transcription factor [Geomesophilobacter sediminis]MBJ6723334.1 metalloregulator ArsR/SmtB family transcription factor [Geomesophilobacter sediminis]